MPVKSTSCSDLVWYSEEWFEAWGMDGPTNAALIRSAMQQRADEATGAEMRPRNRFLKTARKATAVCSRLLCRFRCLLGPRQ